MPVAWQHLMNSRALTSAASAVLAVTALGSAWLYARRADPVVLTLDTAPAATDIGTQILNPFRDRSPELCAEHFLAELRDEHYATALLPLFRDPAALEAQGAQEQRSRITSFVLEGRRDRDDTLLYFRTMDVRGDDEGCYVTVRCDAGAWRVVRYERYD